MLKVSRLYSIYDKMINEHGIGGGIRTGRGSHSTQRKPSSMADTCKLWFNLKENILLYGILFS
jgi:hypothetical protein